MAHHTRNSPGSSFWKLEKDAKTKARPSPGAPGLSTELLSQGDVPSATRTGSAWSLTHENRTGKHKAIQKDGEERLGRRSRRRSRGTKDDWKNVDVESGEEDGNEGGREEETE